MLYFLLIILLLLLFFYKLNTITIKIAASCNHRSPSTTRGVATNGGIGRASIGEIRGGIGSASIGEIRSGIVGCGIVTVLFPLLIV